MFITMETDAQEKALKSFLILNSIIKLSADRLQGLRTQCATNAEITHQEIRHLEGKLVKLFSDQLLAKKSLAPERLPRKHQINNLRLWLHVVGLSKKLIEEIVKNVSCLENLSEKSEQEIRYLVLQVSGNEEDVRRLTQSIRNLKRYTELLYQRNSEDDSASSSFEEPVDLYWDSWDSNKNDSSFISSARSSVSSEDYQCCTNAEKSNGRIHPIQHSCATTPCTPIATIAAETLNSPTFSPGSQPNICSPSNSSVFSPSSISPNSLEQGLTPPSTPPVKGDKKLNHSSVTSKSNLNNKSNLTQPDGFPLTKSKSHESQLANRVESSSENNLTSLDRIPKRRDRLPTEPGPAHPWEHGEINSVQGSMCSTLPSSGGVKFSGASGSANHASKMTSISGHEYTTFSSSPIKSPPLSNAHSNLLDDLDAPKGKATTLYVPKSPRTPTLTRSMGHVIAHRFTRLFHFSTSGCDYCNKPLFRGVKCKECKFKCHKDCQFKVPPSCGLPTEFIDVFAKSLQTDKLAERSSQSPNPSFGKRDRKITRGPGNMHVPPFSGPDSSSNTSSCNSSAPSSPATFSNSVSASSNPNQYFFSDGCLVDGDVTLETRPLSSTGNHELSSTEKSNDSDRTISQNSGSGSTDSEKTLALRVDSQDSQISDSEQNDRTWPRQNSLSNREWDIPYDELKIGDKIGVGHFGIVYRGNWHGDVAIKVLDMDYQHDKTLEQFKQEVAIFRKTRHENLVLFMGACMKPPRLAIVTSFCKGLSLYTMLHVRKEKFNMSRTASVATQIAQGMGYLHAKGIVHKDLKSKNVFVESQKVVITDFGLFNVAKLCQRNRNGDAMSIPQGWLCYLAPEIIKSLKPMSKYDDNLPFSKASDVYAFGTIWYELLCGEWPYQGLPSESVIWQVGAGIRQPIPTLFSRDVKVEYQEILIECWSVNPEDRINFSKIQKIVEKLPKKRLARSPSHPIHLSRSAESVF